MPTQPTPMRGATIQKLARKDAARSIRYWAIEMADDYEALAGAAIIETDDKRQALHDHDQYIGAAAAMRAMAEKIEGEFSL